MQNRTGTFFEIIGRLALYIGIGLLADTLISNKSIFEQVIGTILAIVSGIWVILPLYTQLQK